MYILIGIAVGLWIARLFREALSKKQGTVVSMKHVHLDREEDDAVTKIEIKGDDGKTYYICILEHVHEFKEGDRLAFWRTLNSEVHTHIGPKIIDYMGVSQYHVIKRSRSIAPILYADVDGGGADGS